LERLRQPNRAKAAEPASKRLMVEGSGNIEGTNATSVTGIWGDVGRAISAASGVIAGKTSQTPISKLASSDSHPFSTGALLWIKASGPESWPGQTSPWAWQRDAEPRTNTRPKKSLTAVFLIESILVINYTIWLNATNIGVIHLKMQALN
jgi:hypothetical protein